MVTVASADELRAHLAGYPGHETLLVEEKVAGQEYSVESLVQSGKVVFASVTRKETTESHAQSFVELAHSVPGTCDGAEETLLEANQRMLERLAFADGIAHSEWRTGGRRPPVPDGGRGPYPR
ncbi:hypothetical protein GCM10020000_38590 [Streptomyces olivoverticillatus]